MRWAALAAALSVAGPAAAQYTGWTGASSRHAGEKALACTGEGCGASGLRCTIFVTPPPAEPVDRIEALLEGDRIAWGQLHFWVAARSAEARPDLTLKPPGSAADPRPAIRDLGGRRFVWIAYAASAGSADVALPVALWLDGGGVRGLGCLYQGRAGDASEHRIDELLGQLLPR